jgi:mannan endo-1,4-beta-mannosidase
MRSLGVGAAVWVAVFGAACAESSGEAGPTPAPPFGDESPAPEQGTATNMPSEGGAEVSPGSGSGETPLVPSGIAGEPPPVSAPPAASNGLIIDGMCRALCASAETDADAMGVTDGWGWENQVSCVVPDGVVASRGSPCTIDAPPAVPVPPTYVPDGNVIRPEGTESAGFFVLNGRLYDRRGNDFVMRGVNNPLAWYQNRQTGALAWLTQIASTGANAVRLVWETDAGDVALLREAVERTLELQMVPMIELHDVTGSTAADGPANMARYYTETEAVRQILLDHEDSLLVNVANEWTGADAIFTQSYTEAINIFRSAGIRHTLVIDSNGWGQQANTVITQGQALLAADPQHNLLFSAHMYEVYRTEQTIRDTLARAVNAQIPFIVGEFGFQHGSDAQGNPYAIPFEVLLEESVRLGIGYLGWSWTGNSGGVEYLDLTARSGSAMELTPWGDELINGASGIRATAEPASIFFEVP